MRNGETLIPGKGERITCIQSGVNGGPFIFEFELEPGVKGPPMHTHEEGNETFEVLEGEIEIRVGRRVHRCRAGDRLTLTPDDPHTFRNPSGSHNVRCRVEHGGRFERAIVQRGLPQLAVYIHRVDAGSIRVHNPVLRVMMRWIAAVAALAGVKPVLTDPLSGGAGGSARGRGAAAA